MSTANDETLSFFSQPKAPPAPPKKVKVNKPQAKIEKSKPILKKEELVVKKEQYEEERIKTYPERKFDRYKHKNARLKTDDLEMLTILCNEISNNRRYSSKKSSTRITENTFLREILSLFCRKVELEADQIDYTALQTEEEVTEFIERIMSH